MLLVIQGARVLATHDDGQETEIVGAYDGLEIVRVSGLHRYGDPAPADEFVVVRAAAPQV